MTYRTGADGSLSFEGDDIDDGYNDTIEVSADEFWAMTFCYGSKLYDIFRNLYKDWYGCINEDGQAILSASIVNDVSSDNRFGYLGIIGSIALADLAIPEPSDAILPIKAIGYFVATGFSAWDYFASKRDRAIDRIQKRNLNQNEGVLYYLLTEKDGYYDYLRSGEKGNIFLEEGEIWKIGETIQWNPITRQQYRYSEAWLQDNNLFFLLSLKELKGK